MKNTFFETIKSQFEYHLWATERLSHNIMQMSEAEYTRKLPLPFKTAAGLFHHLYDYDAKYHHRLTQKSEYTHATFLSRTELSLHVIQLSKKWLNWINHAHTAEVEKHSILLLDVCSHNRYHQGQLNTLIALSGCNPHSLDVFLYRSEKEKLVHKPDSVESDHSS